MCFDFINFFFCRFGNYLVDRFQLDPARIHLMGHSLGAHISSYMAKGIPGVGQLTGEIVVVVWSWFILNVPLIDDVILLSNYSYC